MHEHKHGKTANGSLKQGQFVCLFVCFLGSLVPCLFVCLFVCFLASLLVWSCLFVCLFVCLFTIFLRTEWFKKKVLVLVFMHWKSLRGSIHTWPKMHIVFRQRKPLWYILVQPVFTAQPIAWYRKHISQRRRKMIDYEQSLMQKRKVLANDWDSWFTCAWLWKGVARCSVFSQAKFGSGKCMTLKSTEHLRQLRLQSGSTEARSVGAFCIWQGACLAYYSVLGA